MFATTSLTKQGGKFLLEMEVNVYPTQFSTSFTKLTLLLSGPWQGASGNKLLTWCSNEKERERKGPGS